MPKKLTKEIFRQWGDMQSEIKDLQKRISKTEKQTKTVSDVVQNGYKKHAVIYGIDLIRQSKLEKYKSKLETYYNKLLDLQNLIEDYIEEIPDSKTRQIFRHRYLDNMGWVQIQMIMNYKHEDTARKKHDKYLEKFFLKK